MPELSQEQQDKRAEIKKGATIFGAIAGVVAGLLVLWILGGQGAVVRFGGALVVGGGVGMMVFRANFKARAADALCAACGAAFSRARSDRAETLASSTDREERAAQDDGSTKVTTWIEDTFDVVDSYTCAKCGDVTTEAYTSTRRRDEDVVIEPAEVVAATEEDAASDPGPSADARSKRARTRRR